MPLSTDATTDTLLTTRLRLQLLDSRQQEHAGLYRTLYTCPRVMAAIAPPMTEAEARAAFVRVCRHNGLESPGHRAWAIHSRETDGGLGIVALHRSGSGAELGLMLLPQAWNGRVSSASLAAVIDYGFGALGLNRIDADCRGGRNSRILRHLLVPLGFVPVSALRPGYMQWTLSFEHWRPH